MTIEIVTVGGTVTVVEGTLAIVYIKTCPYNEPHDFRATNPRQIFCCDSHKVMYFKKHKN